MSALERFTCATLLLPLSVLAATAQAESADDHWGCAYNQDGGCTVNARSYGYYPTRWRKWPQTPRMAAAEAIGTPTPAEPRPATARPPEKSEADSEPRQAPPQREKVPPSAPDEQKSPLIPQGDSEMDEPDSPPDLKSDLPQPPLERDLHKLLPEEPSTPTPTKPRDEPAEDDPFRDDPLPDDMPSSSARKKSSIQRTAELRSMLRDPRPQDRKTDPGQSNSAVNIGHAAAPAREAASQRSIENPASVALDPARRIPARLSTPTSNADRPAAIATKVEATPIQTTKIEAKIETTRMETTPIKTTPIKTTLIKTTKVETTPVETAPIQTTKIEGTKIHWRSNPLAGRTASSPSEPSPFRTAELTSANRETVQSVAHQVNPLRESQPRPTANANRASADLTGEGVQRAARWSADENTLRDAAWRGNPLRSSP